jgi:subtilisin family serine protease
MKIFFFLSQFALGFLYHRVFAQETLTLKGTSWTGTHSPLSKGSELYFQGDTLAIVDLDGIDPPDQYLTRQKSDTLILTMLEEFSVACREEIPALYRIFWANNGEKLLLKPIVDGCMPRFTRLVASSPWYRKNEPGTPPADWPFLQPEKDPFAGVGLYDAYKLLKFRTASPVVVAIIDCPLDYSHEDLAPAIWKNPLEIPENKIDDEKNGFKDDVRGWFFPVSREGVVLQEDQLAEVQMVDLWGSRFANGLPEQSLEQDRKDFILFQKAQKFYSQGKTKADQLKIFFSDSLALADLLSRYLMESEEPITKEQILSWKSGSEPLAGAVKGVLISWLDKPGIPKFEAFVRDMKFNFTRHKAQHRSKWEKQFNPDWKPRTFTQDHPEIPNEKMYGAGFLQNPGDLNTRHGTVVAGVIGARRGNGKGMEGICEQAQILPLGAVPPTGDWREKDVANCIRYAADKGAKIINLSFTKSLPVHLKVLEDAIRYAEGKGVLFVHEAGNQAENRDSVSLFPMYAYSDGTPVKNWLEVGASTPTANSKLIAPFSAYGPKSVHLFAPGTNIFTCYPGNKYGREKSTSLAAPMVTGIAALIWSYFPKLTAAQIKLVLMESVYKPVGLLVEKPGSRDTVPLSSLCLSGGLVNARNAVWAAEKLLKKKKP